MALVKYDRSHGYGEFDFAAFEIIRYEVLSKPIFGASFRKQSRYASCHMPMSLLEAHVGDQFPV